MKKEKFLKICEILKDGKYLRKLVTKYKFTEKELDFLFERAQAKKSYKKAIL